MIKLSAFTLIKNAIKFDYPIVESVNSLLPFVDEYVINLGDSDDGTKELIYSNFKNNAKVKIFETIWETKHEGTTFFSSQTQNALNKCTGDWCFYLQADEAIHEEYGSKLKELIEIAEKNNKSGITFKYYHFEKTPVLIRKTYEDGFDAYDKELRLFKNDGRLVSFGDAQSFCFVEDLLDSRGPQPALHRIDRFMQSDFYIYHYGYLKDPRKMLEKKIALNEFYKVSHPDRNESIESDSQGNYVFLDDNKLKPFFGSHPSVMARRLENFISIEENNE